MIDIHYFASIRETLGQEKESLELPDAVNTVELLVSYLAGIHGENWNSTLSSSTVLVAINQVVASHDASIQDGDEIAFFPPVTGG